MTNTPDRIVLGITGASGAIYSIRLLQALVASGVEIHLAISPSGSAVIGQELGLRVDTSRINAQELLRYQPPWSSSSKIIETAEGTPPTSIHCHRYDNFMAPIASGSFKTTAMVICPCSGTTLSGIAHASSTNLIQRAAEVHLKEHRKLVLVPRETPLSVLQLENMHRLATVGAVILPAMPGWYHGVTSLDSLVDFVVARILDQIGVENHLIRRWGESEPASEEGAA